MPTPTDPRSTNVQRPQYDRDRQPAGDDVPEPRDFESEVSDGDKNYDAPFDAALEPIDDREAINRHGSER